MSLNTLSNISGENIEGGEHSYQLQDPDGQHQRQDQHPPLQAAQDDDGRGVGQPQPSVQRGVHLLSQPGRARREGDQGRVIHFRSEIDSLLSADAASLWHK